MSLSNKSETPRLPPGVSLAARLAPLANRDPHHTIDGSGVDGQACKEPEKLVRSHGVPLTGVIEAPVAQSSSDVCPKDVGSAGHVSILDINGQECQEALRSAALALVKPDRFDAYSEWVDSKRAALQLDDGDPYSLESLAAPWCTGADAVDKTFVNDLLAEMDDEPTERKTYALRPEILERFDRWWARRPKLSDTELVAIRDYLLSLSPETGLGAHVQILWDVRADVFSGSAAAYMATYSKCLPIGWRDGVVIALTPGELPRILRWSDKRVMIDETKKLCVDTRFHAPECASFRSDTQRVLIPAAVPACNASIQSLLAPAQTAPAARVYYPTGIAALDKILRTPGIPKGDRVIVQGNTAMAKTAFLLEIAEYLASRLLHVVWMATGDDSVDNMLTRRLQRIGVPQGSEPPPGTSLGAGLSIIDGRTHKLEEVLTCARDFDVLFLDPVSNVMTRHDVSEQVVRIGHVLDLIERSGVTCFASAPNVRAAGRRAQTERALGGARIERGASLLMELSRSGNDLTVSIVKSRLGGEGQELLLNVDVVRQRIITPANAVALPADERIWTDIRAALSSRGPLTARTLAERTVHGRATNIRTVIRKRIAAGDLREVDGKVSL